MGGVGMKCPTCDVPLNFVDEGHYRTNANKPFVGRYYECPLCGAEFLRKSGGTWKQITDGVVEVCEMIEQKNAVWR